MEFSRREFLAVAGGGAVAPFLTIEAQPAAGRFVEVPTLLDHFILGCADLEQGVALVEKHTGVRAVFGGVHPGRGTRNALLSLGERKYLEIMAPDPAQHLEAGATVPGSRPSPLAKLRELKEPRIIGWAAHPGDLQNFAAKLQKAKIEFVGPRDGSRKRPDGKVLRWKTLTLKDDYEGLLPFFIEWSADSVHPSADAPKGCRLVHFLADSPEWGRVRDAASVLGLDLGVNMGTAAVLSATMVGPEGNLDLTS